VPGHGAQCLERSLEVVAPHVPLQQGHVRHVGLIEGEPGGYTTPQLGVQLRGQHLGRGIGFEQHVDGDQAAHAGLDSPISASMSRFSFTSRISLSPAARSAR
jgi:hypothetical protein